MTPLVNQEEKRPLKLMWRGRFLSRAEPGFRFVCMITQYPSTKGPP